MSVQTAIWVPPSLCGCQLQITANFTDGSVDNGVTYRHPIPFTIKDIKIVNVCSGHQPQTLSMPDVSGLYEINPRTGDSYQARGYLEHPIENPTDAHNLYQFLCFYGGQTHALPCGCQSHQFVDENKEVAYVEHPAHTKKCLIHRDDTVDMKQAIIDCTTLQEADAPALIK